MRCFAVLLTAGVCALVPCAPAQDSAAKDVWAPLRFLEGRWNGPSKGQAGSGEATREYRFELRGRFLQGKSRAVYPAQPGKEKEEIHEDFSIFSFDKVNQRFVMRQFHVESFVNSYAAPLADLRPGVMEFVSYEIENLPAGWRCKEVYTIVSPVEFVETFYLAPPGKDFSVYSEVRLKKVP
jgi:hypothetical protein